MADKLKVLFVTAGRQPVPITKGGAVEALVEELLDENEKHYNFDFEVISIYEQKASEECVKYRNARFTYFKRNPFWKILLRPIVSCVNTLPGVDLDINLDYTTKVTNFIQNRHYDKIVIENRPYLVLPVAKVSDADIILHLHNNYLNRNIKNCGKTVVACHSILTVSEYIKRCVMTIPGSDPQKIKVLRNCIDTEVFDPSRFASERQRLRSSYGFAEKDIVLFYSGRLAKNKGVKQLMEAFLKIDDPNIKLLIVGSSWYGTDKEDQYVRKLKKLASAKKDQVVFTGFQPYGELPKFHALSDIAVVPSIWEEPGALVVMEAMSSALPLIMTDSGGIPEYVDENCAIIVKRDKNLTENLAKQMRELAYDPEKRERMGRAGRNRAVSRYDKKMFYQTFQEHLGYLDANS